jgi:hypothetical protein
VGAEEAHGFYYAADKAGEEADALPEIQGEEVLDG